MKYLIILLFPGALHMQAQIDTLVIGAGDTVYPDFLKDSLDRGISLRKLNCSLDGFPLYGTTASVASTKKTRRFFAEFAQAFDKRLSEVKVLYILNPMGYGGDNAPGILAYDTLHAPVYKLDFSRMTSLETVYLVGDDSDDITEMPAAFYNTPVKILHASALRYPGLLKSHVEQRNRSIRFILDPASNWEINLHTMGL